MKKNSKNVLPACIIVFAITLITIVKGFSGCPHDSISCIWSVSDYACVFRWDLLNDRAILQSKANNSLIWSGALLPAYLLALDMGVKGQQAYRQQLHYILKR